tara:strand:+ start:418 stop:1068 length:651 start_codon:yes stop_codon:yes gene_type:complete
MKVNIDIPSSLAEISLRQYKEFLNIESNTKDEQLLKVKMMQIFCNISIKDIMRLKLVDSENISNMLNELFTQKPSLVIKFKIKNKEYGFHPQLDDLTLGEYIDLDTYLSDWENIEKAMNVLYRPITSKLKDKYSIEEYTIGKDDNLLDMPMDAVLSSIFFFWNLGLDLSKAMIHSLDQGQKDWMEHLISQKNTDGIKACSLDSLKEILEDLKISLN